MCTAVAFHAGGLLFGRNMDLEYSFNENIVLTPRNYVFKFSDGEVNSKGYAMIGIATVKEMYPLYAEAMNEKGVAMAGLNFPGQAYYGCEKESKINISPFEFIPWILRKYSCVQDIRRDIDNINLYNHPFSENLPLAPLHWMISDQKESIVIESMKDGLHIHENIFHVLTNNPPFSYHYWNIHRLGNISTRNIWPEDMEKMNLIPYAQGMGAMGLPGDSSSPSRFLRAWFYLSNSTIEEDEDKNIAQVFHILSNVAMIKGGVVTDNKENDLTRYSCCMDTINFRYYYKTYYDMNIHVYEAENVQLNGKVLIVKKIEGLPD